MTPLITAQELQSGVAGLAGKIAADYEGRPLTILGVLTGSIIFLSDLVRQLNLPVRVGLIQASSYRGEVTAPGTLHIQRINPSQITGRDVLLLDDIYDTGQTLAGLLDALGAHQPRSIRSAVLLWKEGRQRVPVIPDYYCFKIPDAFVVGYGLDYNDDFRHLPFVASLESADLQR